MRKEEREEKMVLLDVKIKELLQKVEEAGEEGRVQEATDLQAEVDKLQEELTQFKEVRISMTCCNRHLTNMICFSIER